MIFVTVGSQEPFDRLIRAVDKWAAERGHRNVFAQIASGAYKPRHIEFADFMEPAEFKRRVAEASVIVAHAGMGSILTALELGKPIIVMPRREHLHETRSDHQFATSQRFGAQGRIIVAADERDLFARLDDANMLAGSEPISAQASPQLMQTIRAFLDGAPFVADNSPKTQPAGLREAKGTLPKEA